MGKKLYSVSISTLYVNVDVDEYESKETKSDGISIVFALFFLCLSFFCVRVCDRKQILRISILFSCTCFDEQCKDVDFAKAITTQNWHRESNRSNEMRGGEKKMVTSKESV